MSDLNVSGKIKQVVAMEYLSSKPSDLTWEEAFDILSDPDNFSEQAWDDAYPSEELYGKYKLVMWEKHEDDPLGKVQSNMENLYLSIKASLFT